MSNVLSNGCHCRGGLSATAKPRGLTLVELIVTLAIVAILTMAAIPSFTRMIEGNRLPTQMNELLADINLARGEAAKRGRPVSLCTAGCWKDGWMVLVYANNRVSTSCAVESGDTLIRRRGALAGAPKVAAGSGGGLNAVTALTYGSDGVAYVGTIGKSTRTYLAGFVLEMRGSVCNITDIGGSLQRLTLSNTGYPHLCRKGDTAAYCTTATACLTVQSGC